MAAPTQLKLALIGVGRIGAVHLAHIRRHPRIALVSVVEADTARGETIQAEVPGCVALSDVEQLLERKSELGLQAAVVCTPTLTHFEIVMKLLNAGIAVFVEKPLSLDIAQIDAAYELAKEKSLTLLTGYQRRFDPNFNAVADQIHSGEHGQVHLMRSTSRDNPVPSVHFLKTSGGIMHDCGSHDIHLVRWVVGETPTEVTCMGSCFNPDIRELDDCDTIVMSMRFPSGALATVDLSRHACYGYVAGNETSCSKDQRIEVHATKGMLQADNQKPTTMIRSTANGRSYDSNCYSFPQRYAAAYEAELAHFVEAILDGAPLKVTHEDVRTVAIIADAATEALKTGKPVKVVT